ncbi:MAG TPA: hypothetical protein VEC06_08965 [Paucimonas sp.]|nr:hypothetical protein [Paucimonas sp.]
MPFSKYACLPLAMLALLPAAHAESKKISAQYWVDLSTAHFSMPGMPEDMRTGGGGGFLGGLFGGAAGSGAAGGKSLEAALYVRAHPAGVEGNHAVPAGMNMGASLPLMPIPQMKHAPGAPTHERTESAEKPKGRILLYWGCGESVRQGQPRIIDFATQSHGDYAHFFSSRGGYSKGAQASPGNSVWPNERDSKRVPEDASLLGEHAVTGPGVPASLKFQVDGAHDFLPRLQVKAKGELQDSIELEWNAMQNAKGYFLQAQGSSPGPDGAVDLILWSSSEKPENGWSLMNYQAPAHVAKLVQQKVVLAPTASKCAVPKGIYGKAEGAMLNMIAYGPELNVSHPPRPPKAPADWQPEWTARVRVKSTGMAMLGAQGAKEGSASKPSPRSGEQPAKAASEVQNAVDILNGVNMLKGLFGK